MEEVCKLFIKYLNYLDKANEVLNRLRMVQAELVLELEDYRKGVKRSIDRSNIFTFLRGRLRAVRELIERIEKATREFDIGLALFLLESYAKKARQLNLLNYLDKVLEIARDLGDRWSEERLKIEDEITSLNAKIEELNDNFRELEIRYSIGEFDRLTFEEKRRKLEEELEFLTSRKESLEKFLEERDLQFLRIMEELESLQGV